MPRTLLLSFALKYFVCRRLWRNRGCSLWITSLNLPKSTVRIVKKHPFLQKYIGKGQGGYISLPVGFSALCAARSPAAPPPSVYRFFSGLKRGFCWCFWGGFLLVVFRFLFVCFKTLFFVFLGFWGFGGLWVAFFVPPLADFLYLVGSCVWQSFLFCGVGFWTPVFCRFAALFAPSCRLAALKFVFCSGRQMWEWWRCFDIVFIGWCLSV